MSNETAFDEWCILELFGHVRLAGRVREQTIGGASFIRLDVPSVGDEPAVTKFYGQSAVYCMTPVSEGIARSIAARCNASPIRVYELPAAPALLDDSAADADQVDEVDDDFCTCEACEARYPREQMVPAGSPDDPSEVLLCPTCAKQVEPAAEPAEPITLTPDVEQYVRKVGVERAAETFGSKPGMGFMAEQIRQWGQEHPEAKR